MKFLVLLIILFSLYLIYRLSFPKQAGNGQENEPERREPPEVYEPVVKSRFVLPVRSNLAQHEDRKEDSGKQDKKPVIFAAGNEKRNAVIPPGELDEVFGEDVNPEELDIEPDEPELNESALDEEENEDLRQTLGRDAQPAGGFSIEELENAVKAVDNPADENAGLLYRVEKTDMFEKLVSGNEGKMQRIRAVIDRHEQSIMSGVSNGNENESGGDWKDFNMAGFLS